MSSWPPSPSVEDELVSLSHEYVTDASLHEGTEDTPVKSRGVIDQYPIIVETDERPAGTKPTVYDTSKGGFAPDTNSSDDSPGPSTPPPVIRETRSRPASFSQTKSVSFLEPDTTSQSSQASNEPQLRNRPPIAKIDTRIGYDNCNLPPIEPQPSLHAQFTDQTLAERVAPKKHTAADTAQSSDAPPRHSYGYRPLASDTINQVSGDHRRHAEKEVAEIPEREQSKSRHRSWHRESLSPRLGSYEQSRNENTSNASEANHRQYLAAHERGSQLPSPTSRQAYADRFTPPTSRRVSRDSLHGYSNEDFPLPQPYPPDREAKGTWNSPYASSVEDSSRAAHIRHERQPNSMKQSSPRRERPRLEDLTARIHSNDPASAYASASPRPQPHSAFLPRVPSYPAPGTPLSSQAAKSMEDYFERAFYDNSARRMRTDFSIQGYGSAVVSPITSPPRTPRSEQDPSEYFTFDPSSRMSRRRGRAVPLNELRTASVQGRSTVPNAAEARSAVPPGRTESNFDRTNMMQPPPGHDDGHVPRSAPNSRRGSPVLGEVGRPRYLEASSRAQASRPVANDAIPASGLHRSGAPPHSRRVSYNGNNQQSRNMSLNTGFIDGHTHVVGENTVQDRRCPEIYVPQPVKTTPSPLAPPRLNEWKCPMPKPSSDARGWHSIKDISTIDICPSCTSVLRYTRLQNLLVPSLPKPYEDTFGCAVSKPWLRVALLHSLKHGEAYLRRSVSNLLNPPKSVVACGGETPSTRRWFYIRDPVSKGFLDEFPVCVSCVWAIDTVFPNLKEILERPDESQPRQDVCSLHTDTRHFDSLLDHFRSTAADCYGRAWRASDARALAGAIQHTHRCSPCTRDAIISRRTWHMMSELPEFTICEECFGKVVWPLRERPIARDISPVTKVVPAHGKSPGFSCQLYSGRMRQIFRDAVNHGDFVRLRDAVRDRQASHARLLELNRLYESDQRYGLDRRAEIGRNMGIWRTIE